MKILASVYAVNPYKGSEDGTGWNLVLQIARFNTVKAITRKNNQEDIERYMEENPDSRYENITWLYYDLPKWARFWKRGSKGAMPYYLLWQFFLPLFVFSHKIQFDIAHALNFHNDWTFSLLWIFGKPFVWGPIGHHPKIPKEFLGFYSKKDRFRLRNKTYLKQFFWTFEPLLKLTKRKASHIFAVNSEVSKVLNLEGDIKNKKISILPAVANEEVINFNKKEDNFFTILSVGRFVPLKGFDLAIQAFSSFYKSLGEAEQKQVRFYIIGKGPAKEKLLSLTKELELENAIYFVEWMERAKLNELYRNADCFLFPSHEGAGMVVPEALSYGLPVICLDNCGPGELIDVSCGFKAPYSQYKSTIAKLADGLKILHSNPSLKYSMGKAAIERYTNYFDWDVKGNTFQEVYLKISNSTVVKEVPVEEEQGYFSLKMDK